jgi:hypothetical protein
MSVERANLPDWANQEREQDFAWINENLPIFEIASKVAFDGSGRGALVVDTRQQPILGLGHPFGYVAQEHIEEYADDDTRRMVKQYDPEVEFVIVLLKAKGRSSTYRVSPQQPPSAND